MVHLCDFAPNIVFKSDDIIVIDNFYTKSEAYELINKIDKLNKFNGTKINKKNRSVCIDKELAKMIFTTISSIDKFNIDKWIISNVNNNFRFIKGEPGYSMGSHLDKKHIESINKKSFFTILLYLNDSDGNIVFDKYKISFEPKPNRLIIFNQNLVHHALPSTNEKYFIHSEIMFNRQDEIVDPNDLKAFKKYVNAQQLPEEQKNIEEDEAFSMSKIVESLVLD
jgi:hypothetical protein